ncbi:MAG: hypothetical protein H6773_01480 [Pseudomonadales bacterium]|nr:hypothetical protein [Candidatus Woesebacteria bacterium]MCB9800828.1 hypothetical protein [Pseudomonadales bacterium]
MKRTLLLCLTLGLIILGASWSLFPQGMFKIHDFIHGVRIAEMTRALGEGQFPVRWSEHFGYGYGMPLFEFYAPLPYYVGSLFYQLGLPLVTSVKLLFWLCSIGTAFGAYYLGKQLFSHKSAGVLVSAAYTLAPYRALNLFVRGALSEAWGMMALPWILYGISVARTDKWHGFWATTAGLVILLLSHNLTAIIAAPFIAVFALVMLWLKYTESDHDVRSTLEYLGSLVGSAGLSLGLTAFYMFPALLEKQYTQIENTILSGYFDFSLHFLYIRQFFSGEWGYGGSEWGPGDPISFYLGTAQVLVFVIVAVITGRQFIKDLKNKKNLSLVLEKKYLISLAVVFMLGGSLYMSLQRSIGIWRALSFLSFIQFPWRYLSVASLAAALLFGVPYFFIKGRAARTYIVVMYILIVVSSVFYFRPEEYYQDISGLYYDDPDRVESHMSEILPDYIPTGVQLEDIHPPTYEVLCDGEVCEHELLVNRGHEKLFKFVPPLSGETTLTFAISDFPGWVVTADTNEIPHFQNENGLITANIPAQTEFVGVQLRGTQTRDWSDVTSFFSFVMVLCLFAVQNKKRFFRRATV